MRGCSGWYMQPLSTLSASIEHPLGEGGDQVEGGLETGQGRVGRMNCQKPFF